MLRGPAGTEAKKGQFENVFQIPKYFIQIRKCFIQISKYINEFDYFEKKRLRNYGLAKRDISISEETLRQIIQNEIS